MVVGLNKGIYARILLVLCSLLVLSVVASAFDYIAIDYADPRLNLTNLYWKVMSPIDQPTEGGYLYSKNDVGVTSNIGKFHIRKSGTYNVWTYVVADALGQCRSGGHTRRINLRQTHALKLDSQVWVDVVPQTEPYKYTRTWVKAYDQVQLNAGEHTIQLKDTGGAQDPCGVALIYSTYAITMVITDNLAQTASGLSYYYNKTSDVIKGKCDAFYWCEDDQTCFFGGYFLPAPGATGIAATKFCCGDQSNEVFTKFTTVGQTFYRCLVNEPDSAQSVCGAVTGQYEWWNPDQNIGTLDDNCCGDDDYDNGAISKESAAGGVYLMCDRTDIGTPVVRQATNVYAGSVYKIERPSQRTYDVLTTATGKFIPCSYIKHSGNYAFWNPAGTFVDYQNRIRVGSSEFLCDVRGDRGYYRIYECRNAMPSGGRYTALTAQEEKSNDDNRGFVMGKAIVNPFPEDWSGFSRQSETPCSADFCTTFANPIQDELSTNTFKLVSWYNGDFAFDIYFENPEKAKDLDFYLAGRNTTGVMPSIRGQLSQYFTSSRKEGTGRWYHVIIPKERVNVAIPSGFAIGFALIPKTNIGKVKLSNPHLKSTYPQTFYCGEDLDSGTGKWITDPDDNGKACDALLTADWTGTRCCGDDRTTENIARGNMKGEFFFDTDGMCFNSLKVPETGTVQRIAVPDAQGNKKFKLLADSDTGKIYSCGADESGFGWLTEIRSTDGSNQDMVEEAQTCDAFGTRSRSYFCNGTEWDDATYTITDPDNFPGTIKPLDRTVQSKDPTGTKLGCCRQDECFDGTTCVDSEHDDQPEEPEGGGTMCMRGHWINASIIYDWLTDEFGFCAESSECLLDPDADTLITSDETLSICKPSGWYAESSQIEGLGKSLGYNEDKINAIYCDDGKWMSRTKFIAQKMLAIPSTEDYTLVCGFPSEVLVDEGLGFRGYSPIASSAMRFTNEFDEDVFNHLCILQYRGKLILGASFNKFGDDIEIPIENQISIEKALYEAFDIKYIDFSVCGGSSDRFDFKACIIQSDSATNARFYWNDMTQTFIYTPNGGDVLSTGFISSLYNLFITPILNLLDVVKQNIFEVAPTPLQDTTLFSRLYVRKLGNRRIFSIIEPKKGTGSTIYDYMTARYENFPEDICASVDIYDIERAQQAIMCNKNGTVQTVFAVVGSNNPVALLAPRDFVQSITQQRRIS
ncbi:MAG: hypothetical protein KAT43_01835 [Nanoarchaeota archaeon]|nr:hypothetical protein [Nanoarchaeota archaeon]